MMYLSSYTHKCSSFACSDFNWPKLKNSFSGLIEKQAGTCIRLVLNKQAAWLSCLIILIYDLNTQFVPKAIWFFLITVNFSSITMITSQGF